MPILKYIKQLKFKGGISRKELGVRMFAWALLWPVLIVYTLPKLGLSTLFEKDNTLPKLELSTLFEKDYSYDFSEAIDNRHNELLTLWESTPVWCCTNIVEIHGDKESLLTFNASDLSHYLQELSAVNELNHSRQDRIILKWINQRNTEDDNACKAPREFDRLRNIAYSLLIKGVGKAFCNRCQKEYLASQLECLPHKLSAGWNFKRVECDKGHIMVMGGGVHVLQNHDLNRFK